MHFQPELSMGNEGLQPKKFGRMKRELTVAERSKQCKQMELSKKSFDTMNSVIGNVTDIPILNKVSGLFFSGFSFITNLFSGGLDIASTALDCSSVPFDEIKEIMDKRFNEVERKLDRNMAALNKISNYVAKTLRAVEISRLEMASKFKEVLKTLQAMQIQPAVLKVTQFADFFHSETDRIRGLKLNDYLNKLVDQKENNILNDLENTRTPKINSLQAPLLEIISQDYAVPKHLSDDMAFKALDALIYGTQTYISVMYFLLEQYIYLSSYYYGIGDIDKYNEYFKKIINSFKDFKASLVGNTSSKHRGLLDNVMEALNKVKKTEFLRLLKREFIAMLDEKIDLFSEAKISISEMSLPIIMDQPKNIKGVVFRTNININEKPIGGWKSGDFVKYAVQYEQSGNFSIVSDWSNGIDIYSRACPTIQMDSGPNEVTRYIFRKFKDNKPQLVGKINRYKLSFLDIDRDLYNAAELPDKDVGLEQVKRLKIYKPTIDASFENGRKALHAAAKSGNIRVADYFYDNFGPVDYNVKDKYGYTPLHVAAEYNQGEFIEMLLNRGAFVNARTEPEHSTPLHLAARGGFIKSVNALLKSSKINLHKRNRSGFTALHEAVIGGRYVLESLLRSNTIDVNAKSKSGLTPFHLAIINNDRDVAEILMNSKRVDVNAADSSSRTPLHYAAMLGHAQMAHYLMTLDNININAVTNDQKMSPLHYAIVLKKDDVVSELFKSRITNKDLKADGDITPLHFAVTFFRANVVNKLIEKKVSLEEKTSEGYTALHLASLHKNPELITTLLNGGASIEAKTLNGSTPLHIASKYGNVESAKTLLNRGANIKSSDIYSQTPIHTAAMNDQLEIIREFLAKDATLKEIRNRYGETPLIVAARNSQTTIVKGLHLEGANINAQDNNGMTALHIFAKEGNLDMVKYLFEIGADVYIADRHHLNFFYFAIQNDHLHIVKYALSNNRFSWQAKDRARGEIHSIYYYALCDAVKFNKFNIVKYFIVERKTIACLPLHTAARNGHFELVKYLVEDRKMKVDSAYSVGNSPLCEAAINGHLDIVKYFIGKKAKINKRCMLNNNAFILAVYSNQLKIVEYLANNGAEIEATDVAGNGPIHIAATYDFFDIAKYLIENHNVKINEGNGEWNTPLHLACQHSGRNMVEYLVERGADVTAINRNKQTPLDVAEKHNKRDIVAYLKQRAGKFRRNFSFRDNRELYSAKKGPLLYNHMASNSLPMKGEIGSEREKFENEKSSSKMSSTKASQAVDVTSTLFLLDVLIRYFTDQKYIRAFDDSRSEIDAQTRALKVVEKFEELISFFSKLPISEEIDLAEVHAKIYKALKSGKGNKIQKILCSYADTLMSLNSEQKAKLMAAFNSTLPSIKILNAESSSVVQDFKILPYAIENSCSNWKENRNFIGIEE